MSEPRTDSCDVWMRRNLLVSCPDLSEPVSILDGSEADVPCGPGYHVAVQDFFYPIESCGTDPHGLYRVLIARRPD